MVERVETYVLISNELEKKAFNGIHQMISSVLDHLETTTMLKHTETILKNKGETLSELFIDIPMYWLKSMVRRMDIIEIGETIEVSVEEAIILMRLNNFMIDSVYSEELIGSGVGGSIENILKSIIKSSDSGFKI